MKSIDNMFVNFPPEENAALERLLEKNSHTVRLQAKKIFVSPGDKVDTIYYLKSGRTRHYMISPDGVEQVIYILSSGWFMRESTFLVQDKTATRYSAAEVESELLVIDRRNYDELARYSEFSRALLRSSCIKTEMQRRHAESLSFDSGKERLLKLLRSLCDRSVSLDKNWAPLTIQYTQSEMASILGVTRVSVSRFMSALADEGALRTVNRKIQIRICE